MTTETPTYRRPLRGEEVDALIRQARVMRGQAITDALGALFRRKAR